MSRWADICATPYLSPENRSAEPAVRPEPIHALSAASARVARPPDVPEGVNLWFQSGVTSKAAWCRQTGMWHCRLFMDVVVVVELIPKIQDAWEAGLQSPLKPSEAVPLSESPRKRLDAKRVLLPDKEEMLGSIQICTVVAPASMEKTEASTDSSTVALRPAGRGTFTGTWTGKVCGQIDFHTRWASQSGRGGVVRAFANSARVCVHPEWEEACAACSELVIQGPVSVLLPSDSFEPAWSITCGVQLRDWGFNDLCCPCSVMAVEIENYQSDCRSFGGIGPSPARWLPSVSGSYESTISRVIVDINAGIIWYTLKLTPTSMRREMAKMSLSMVLEQSGQHVRGSPHVLEAKTPQCDPSTENPVRASDKCASPADKSTLPRTLPGLAGRVQEPGSKAQIRITSDEEEAFRGLSQDPPCRTFRPHSPSCSISPQPQREAWTLGPFGASEARVTQDVPSLLHQVRPASVQEARQTRHAKTEPMQAPSEVEVAERPLKNAREAQWASLVNPQLTKPGFASALKKGLAQTSSAVPPGRYMPSQPLPSQTVQRKKHKSKSPSKKHRHARRWAEA
mmetsp:Transcript_57286/g.133992  ORF Transcript_57286/g.133992 Transcript_57286/m.133992 type:complete len:568 (+) Transcript_57286:78-1781(+)